MKSLPLLAALLLAAPAARAQESAGPARLAPGNYTLSVGVSAAARQRLAIVKVSDPEPNKPPITVVASAPGGNPAKLSDIKLDGGRLTMTVTRATPSAVEAAVSPDGKSVLGSMTQGERVFRMLIEPTDKDKLAQADMLVQPKPPEAFDKKRAEIADPINALMRKRRAAKGDERAKLDAELAQANKDAEAKLGPLVREAVAALKGEPFAVDLAEQALSRRRRLRPERRRGQVLRRPRRSRRQEVRPALRGVRPPPPRRPARRGKPPPPQWPSPTPSKSPRRRA